VGLEEDRIVPALNFSSITWQKQLRKREKTPQNFIYKHTADFENVERKKGKKEGENLKDFKLAPTRCQNLSISTTNRLY
jgi:hypothetical protein